MSLPLYAELQGCADLDVLRTKRHTEGHTGLWFERFYNRYPADYSNTKVGENDFREWLGEFNALAGECELLDAATERQVGLVGALQGQFAVFKSPWHFVNGMGYPHPLENGFNWHASLGVPYLPGSGVKGMVRSWVETWAFDAEDKAAQQQKKERLLDWFGSESKDPSEDGSLHTGKVIFFDALPIAPVRLSTDIMTPHMGDWYAKGGEIQDVTRDADKVPADWHSPNPIYFLSAKEPVFLVSIAPRDEVVAQEVDLAEVMQCVEDAFEWLGAGAKTAVGYGQFERDEALTAAYLDSYKEREQAHKVEQEQSAALSGLSGVARELIQFSQQANWEDKNAFLRQGENDIESWLEKLANEPHPAAVSHLRILFEQHFAKPDLLSDPGATSGKKNKPVFKPRAQALAKLFLEIERQLS